MKSILVIAMGAASIACATAARPAVEEERLREVEVSGGRCAYEIVPLNVGVCEVTERDFRPTRIGQDRLVRCGETATVCERAITCDCSHPRRLFDCESFMLPIERAEPAMRSGIEAAARGARANGTPWVSFFEPDEVLGLARDAGFRDVKHVSADALTARYFADRADGLRLPSNSEELLVATT